VKIIHACPKVSKGDKVSVGDKIAVFIHSGYYPFWVDPHIHVELRDPQDPVKASGSYNLRVLNIASSEECAPNAPNDGGIVGVVKRIEKKYAIIQPNPEHWMKAGNFSGLCVSIGKTTGILDGGIPFIGYAGVIADQTFAIGSQVNMGGTQIGEVTESRNGITKLNTAAFRVIVEGLEYLGLSSTLCLGDTRQLKLIPRKAGQIDRHVGESITIKMS